MPNQFLLDASALGKRYLTELGTPAINHFFAHVDPSRIAVLNIGILEVVSIMARNRNRGQITNSYFENAYDAQREQFHVRGFNYWLPRPAAGFV